MKARLHIVAWLELVPEPAEPVTVETTGAEVVEPPKASRPGLAKTSGQRAQRGKVVTNG